VRYGTEGWVMLPAGAQIMKNYKNMKLRKSDVWVLSYPRSGTTWTQEMVWQVANKCDFEGGKVPLNTMERFPTLELDTFLGTPPSPGFKIGEETLIQLEKQVMQRFIKTHMPISALSPSLLETSKVIYVARNPKDTMVSYYHHHKHIKGHGFVGDFHTFVKRFMKDQLIVSPYFKHVEEAWQLRNNPNLLFIFFEDMKKDQRAIIDKVCKFLEVSLTDAEIEKLLDHLDFKNFKKNQAVNLEWGKEFGAVSQEGSFIRKGAVGGYKEEFKNHPELEQEFENWIEDEMKHCTVDFPKH